MKSLGLGVVVLLILALIVGVACCPPPAEETPTPTPETPTPEVTYPTHTDEENGFAVDYPEEWTWSDDIVAETTEAETTGLAAFVSPTAEDGFYPNLVVSKSALPGALPLSMVFPALQVSPYFPDMYPGYASVSDEDTTVAGLDAIKHVFTYTDGDGLDLKAVQVLVVKGQDLWVARCVTTEASFDAYESTFDDIVGSFTFLD